jgi:predicted MPP superfamily phosphohydrolase
MPLSQTDAITRATPRRRRLITRRGFLKACGAVVATGAATYGYGYFIGVKALTVEHVTVTVPGLAARWHNRRIVQLSDLHAGRTSIEIIRRALGMALDLAPDFLVITGDFMDSRYARTDPLAAALKPVTAKVETLGCTGNHDFSHSLEIANRVCGALEGAGVRMLRNGIYQPAVGGAGGGGPGGLCFVGLEDLWSGRADPSTLVAAPRDASVILLAHNPDAYESVAAYRWHLMLSGHTHGGQVVVPGIGPLVLPVEHRERAAGLFHLDAAQPERALYVTRGVGHLLRVRVFCPPEVTCVTLAAG